MMRRLPLLALVCVLAGGALAPAAGAQFGLISSAGAPAFAPNEHSFWAGTCDLDGAPAVGDPIPGGIGSRPATIHQARSNGQYVNPSGPFTAPTPLPAPSGPTHCIDDGTPVQGVPAWFAAPSWRLPAEAQAGAHADGSATFTFDRPTAPLPPGMPNWSVWGSVDNVSVDLPPGLVGNPTAVPKCTAEQFAVKPVQCPPESQVGVANIATREELSLGVNDLIYPVYNLEPREGRVAEFGIPDVAGFTTVRVVAKARTNGDYGVTTFVPQIPAAIELYSQTITLWGVPWAEEHDPWRPHTFAFGRGVPESEQSVIPHSGLEPGDQASYEVTWGAIRPFIANPTECDSAQPPVTRLAIDEYLNPGAFTSEGDPDLTDLDWKVYDAPADPVTGCGAVEFDPDIEIEPTTTAADAATGMNVDLEIPQNDDPPQGVRFNPDDETGAPAHWASAAGRATAQLDKAVVTLPEGVSVNPSGAAGLAGCSDQQIGLVEDGTPARFNNEDPFDNKGAECPDGSKIGTVEVDTPLLEEPLTGSVVLGTPRSTDPQSGEMFRLFIVAGIEDRGLLGKIAGSAVADPQTGRLTATFEKNPRVPFGHMSLRFKGGPRGQLATAQRCGASGWSSAFTPWTAAHGGGGADVADAGQFVNDQNCAYGFAPKLSAGMSVQQGGASGTFALGFSRQDGEQWLRGVSVELPSGLLAAVKDVPLCTGAQAAAGACPAASRIGTVDAGAGSGAPFFLEKKGSAYLTEGYKGAPYGMVVKVPVEAGPFRGQFALKPIVVRQALHVDRTDASVTAISDPFPTIWHGIPLRARQVSVRIDRPGFMRNPTDCAPKRILATIASTEGVGVSRGQAFQAAGCSKLGFKPKLALRLTGKRQTKSGGHPGIRAEVTQQAGEAGIRRAEVRLPRALVLDVDNAQALCEFVDGTKPDLEKRCPAGSIVGRARAVSPLLKAPLAGNAYFVKNVRIDPRTGNPIRTLPMIVLALRGEIAINLRGESDVKGGRLVNTFTQVPDAPVSRFNLNVNGGRNGILVVTETRRSRIDVCRRRQVAQADIDGHNGRVKDSDVTVKTPCKAKRAKRKAAANRRAG